MVQGTLEYSPSHPRKYPCHMIFNFGNILWGEAEIEANCLPKSSVLALKVDIISKSEISGEKDDSSKFRLMFLTNARTLFNWICF